MGGRVVGLVAQRGVGCSQGGGESSRLQLVGGKSCPGPCGRLRVTWAGRRDCQADAFNRPLEVAPEPAEMRRACVRLIEGLEIEHALVRLGRFRESSLLHQRVAKQPVVEDDSASGHEGAGDPFCLVESMELVEDVPLQQQRAGIARIPGLETAGSLVGQRVVARIIGDPRSCHVEIPEPLERIACRTACARLLLRLRDCSIAIRSLGSRSERRSTGVSGDCGRSVRRSGPALASRRSPNREQQTSENEHPVLHDAASCLLYGWRPLLDVWSWTGGRSSRSTQNPIIDLRTRATFGCGRRRSDKSDRYRAAPRRYVSPVEAGTPPAGSSRLGCGHQPSDQEARARPSRRGTR